MNEKGYINIYNVNIFDLCSMNCYQCKAYEHPIAKIDIVGGKPCWSISSQKSEASVSILLQ